MQVGHIQTQITTVFGVLDANGNIIPQQPITAQLQRFDQAAFVEAHAKIAEARDHAIAASEAEPEREPPMPNRAQRRAKP